MTLGEVLSRLEDLDDELTIFAVGGTGASIESESEVCRETDDGSLVCPSNQVLSYVLEVDAAKEVVAVWSDWRDGSEPSVLQMFEAVMYYARNDAYLPT